ncbi:MAG: hypothetical protein M3370_02375 [Actinomycetota bacterium]|nr:hypothetical protein [Actinomycetota bacterium]
MTLLAELDVNVDQLREDVLTALDVPHDVRDTYLRQRKAYELAHQKAREQAQRQQ